MRMIEPSDFANFSAWDGYLVAAFFVVVGMLCRTLVRIMRRLGSEDPTLRTAYWAGTVVLLVAVAGGIAAWQALPARGPGIWGAGAIGGIVLGYGWAMKFVRGAVRARGR